MPSAEPATPNGDTATMERLHGWFDARGWSPFPFQRDTWAAYERGESGLVHVPTGAGKTYAGYFGPLADAADDPAAGLQVLYITPLRAMARDIEAALRAPVDELELPLEVGSRTGDTSSGQRARQKKRLPNVLVTTPESLTLQLTYADAERRFRTLRAVIVDEWHELLGSKRGTQTELALARLRRWCPELRTWALSATLANLEQAAQVAAGAGRPYRIVTGEMIRPITLDTVLPPALDAFPWRGHLGLSMLEPVLDTLDPDRSTLIFTNTRHQAETWYQAIEEARPAWKATMALHHGSIDPAERARVEQGLKSGELTLVVSTSSLDLGVDFSPVERVYQIGSPKGVARIVQRAGRSGHRPGESCRLTFVPTHGLQLLEIAATRKALDSGQIEARVPPSKPLDVLAQHLVTCAMGGGFEADALFDEVRGAASYAELSREEFDWSLDLVHRGGKTLHAYPNYHRVEEVDGRFVVTDRRKARFHRLSVGTITSHASIRLRYLTGQTLGSVEEDFVSRLKPGDRFVFAGRVLEFVKVHDNQAFVRLSKTTRTDTTPRWRGGRMPLSTELADAMRGLLGELRDGRELDEREERELVAAGPILDAQRERSRLPAAGTLLVETLKSREGHHLYLYPFEGRLVHEGLAPLLALRLARRQPATFALSVNDYGLELLCPEPFPWADALDASLFGVEGLLDDVHEAMNLAELARRQFRDIARVAGLVFDGYPGSRKTGRQLQTSAGLLYDVFHRYDPDNLLLEQARREVMERQFEQSRLAAALTRLSSSPMELVELARPSPLAFPLLVDRVGARLSTESLLERIARMKRQWTEP